MQKSSESEWRSVDRRLVALKKPFAGHQQKEETDVVASGSQSDLKSQEVNNGINRTIVISALTATVLFVVGCGANTDRPTESSASTLLGEGSTTSVTPADREASAPTTAPSATSAVELKLSVFDWTETNPPPVEAFVVVGGKQVWTPDLEFGGDVHSFGTFEIGEPSTIVVYPDGHEGSEISVEFVMTSDMISGSDRDQTHVEIYDSEVLVWGTAIPGFEQSFDR